MCQRESDISGDVIKKDVTGNMLVVIVLAFIFYMGFMTGALETQHRDKYMSEYLDAYWDGNAYRLRDKKVNIIDLLRGE